MAISAPMSARLRASAPIIINILVLLYGASFTLTLTVFQSFATAGLTSVKDGVAALRDIGSGYSAEAERALSAMWARKLGLPPADAHAVVFASLSAAASGQPVTCCSM